MGNFEIIASVKALLLLYEKLRRKEVGCPGVAGHARGKQIFHPDERNLDVYKAWLNNGLPLREFYRQK